jgi:cytochrome c553
MKSVASVVASLLLVASASVAFAEEAKPAAKKADLAKGQATSTNVCAACHTSDGSRGSPANPIIQGQHPEYLVKQLGEFKSGQRASPIMQGMAAALTEDDMRNVAAFYAGKQAKPGLAERSIPACAGCHSPNGAGLPAQYPRLAGQHADYTEAQLIAFRAGARKNSAPMTGVAAKLNDREIKAVADYIAGLH